ncbi:MAG: hypothetical protein R2742_12770 [Micropruina glycogenica]
MVLTDAGRQLVTTSAPVLADLNASRPTCSTARSVAAEQVTGEVRVAAFSTAVRGLLVEVLAGLRREHPALRVPLRESEPWRRSPWWRRASATWASCTPGAGWRWPCLTI